MRPSMNDMAVPREQVTLKAQTMLKLWFHGQCYGNGPFTAGCQTLCSSAVQTLRSAAEPLHSDRWTRKAESPGQSQPSEMAGFQSSSQAFIKGQWPLIQLRKMIINAVVVRTRL